MGPWAHVDHHEPTFVELADMFIEICGGVGQFELIPCEDGIGRRLHDVGQAERWLDFHHESAQLRVISDQANLRRKRKAETD